MTVEERTADEAAVVSAVLDYFDGWFDGDAGRMERALHPGLAKRCPRGRRHGRWTRRPPSG